VWVTIAHVIVDVGSAGILGVVIVLVGMIIMVGMAAVGVDAVLIHVVCGVVVDVPATQHQITTIICSHTTTT